MAAGWNPMVAVLTHPQRCQSICKATMKQCRKWAVTGRTRCKSHKGRQVTTQTGRLGVRYSKNLGPKLKEFIQQELDAPDKTLDLTEELAITRAMVGDALVLTKTVFEEPERVDAATRALAHGVLSDMLKNVTSMVDTIARVQKSARETFDAKHLQSIIDQMLRVIKGILEGAGQGHLADKIAHEISEVVCLPAEGFQGKARALEVTEVTIKAE